MDSLEAWLDFRDHESYAPPAPVCYWCGETCSGDSTTSVEIDGLVGELPVCDSTEGCGEDSDDLPLTD